MKKTLTDKCEVCKCKETVEHVLLRCRKFGVERERLKDRIIELGQEWSIKGLLEIGEKQLQTQKEPFIFLKETGLIKRMQVK